jgi:hypothetical protein
MTSTETLTILRNLYFSENKPKELRPIDVVLLSYLVLRQTEDHYITDSQLTLAARLGCERRAIADSVKRLVQLDLIVTKKPYSFSEKTKRKTRKIGAPSGLSINIDNFPTSADRARHSAPSPDAVNLANRHTALLIKHGFSKRAHKNFDRQQEHAAQRLIDATGGFNQALTLLKFSLLDKRFEKAAEKSLYEIRARLPKIKAAYDAAQAAKTEPEMGLTR